MSDWSSDVCSSDLPGRNGLLVFGREHCFDEVLVGIGFVDETLPKFVDCNQARFGAIQREMREEAFCAVGTIGDGDWGPEAAVPIVLRRNPHAQLLRSADAIAGIGGSSE